MKIALLLRRSAGRTVTHPKFMGRLHNRRVGIQQPGLVRPQTQLDQCSGIRQRLRLPPVSLLVARQSIFRGLVPTAGRFARQVVLANQGLLNLRSAGRIDALLAMRLGLRRRFLAFGPAVGGRLARFTGPGRLMRSGRSLGRFGFGGCSGAGSQRQRKSRHRHRLENS